MSGRILSKSRVTYSLKKPTMMMMVTVMVINHDIALTLGQTWYHRFLLT